MSDFFRTLAASGAGSSTLINDRITRSERLRRHFRALPGEIVHGWRASSIGYRCCTLLSLFLFIYLIIAEARHSYDKPPQIARKFDPLQQNGPSAQLGRRTASCSIKNPCTVQMIADLDIKSKSGTNEKPLYMSKFMSGSFYIDGGKTFLKWDPSSPLDVVGKVSEEGRGMELSWLPLE